MSNPGNKSAGCGCSAVTTVVFFGCLGWCAFSGVWNSIVNRPIHQPAPVVNNQGFQNAHPNNQGMPVPDPNRNARSELPKIEWGNMVLYLVIGAAAGCLPGACLALMIGLVAGRAGEKARTYGPLPWYAYTSSVAALRSRY